MKAYLTVIGIAFLILAVVLFVRRMSAALRGASALAGRGEKTPQAGTTVRVRYLPGDPKVAYIESFLHMWAAPLACTVLGLAALAVHWK